MTKIERETLHALREFVHKMMKDTILPPLYEQGLISEKYVVDIRINLRANTAEEALRKMEMNQIEESEFVSKQK